MSEQFFTHDTAAAAIQPSDDGDAESFSLDVARTVRIENPPWVEAFDTDRFHEFDVVAARPMQQTYHVDGEEFVFEKLPEELKKAAWSMDNAPYPIGHPMTGAVQTPDDVHGFLREPEYVEDYDEHGDALTASLYVPVDDQTAIDHIVDHQDVSVGFFNRLDWDTDSEDVDAYQRDMLFDHVAGVTVGRCSGEDGCGIDLDEQVNTVLRVDETEVFDSHSESQTFAESRGDSKKVGGMRYREQCSDGPCSCGLHADQPSGIKTHDGEWYAVGPDEHTKDSTDHPGDHMYPVGGCADVEDAWNLRTHGEDLTIEQSTLEARIKRAADAQDCTGMPWMNDSISNTMTDDTDTDETDSPEIDIDSVVESMSLDALAERHDGVEELQSDLDAAQKEVESKEDRIDVLEDAKEDLEETVEAFEKGERRPKKAVVDSILDICDIWEEEELLEMDRERLEDREQMVEDMASDVAATPSAPSTDNDPDEQPDDSPSADTTDDGYTISMDERTWGDD